MSAIGMTDWNDRTGPCSTSNAWSQARDVVIESPVGREVSQASVGQWLGRDLSVQTAGVRVPALPLQSWAAWGHVAHLCGPPVHHLVVRVTAVLTGLW